MNISRPFGFIFRGVCKRGMYKHPYIPVLPVTSAVGCSSEETKEETPVTYRKNCI